MSVMSTDVAPPVSVEQMAALPSEFRALLESVIAHFERRLAVSEQRLAVSERRIAELEGELRAARKTAQNSSLPPSAEHPHAKTSGPERSRRARIMPRRAVRPPSGSR